MSNELMNTVDFLSNSEVFNRMSQFSEMMSGGVATVPLHLQKNPADCMAVVMQATQWGMNPFAVAQKTHLVNGVLGYEAQLVNAVINSMAPTKDRLHFEYFGQWEKIIGNFVQKKSQKGKNYLAPNWNFNDESGCGIRVYATLKNEDEPRVLELLLVQAQVRNSTLWASDPKQQLAYLAIKRWSRLYCPDVIMGVYTPDELEESKQERNITPRAENKSLMGALNAKKPKEKPAKKSDEYTSWERNIKSCLSIEELTEVRTALSIHDFADMNDKVLLRDVYAAHKEKLEGSK